MGMQDRRRPGRVAIRVALWTAALWAAGLALGGAQETSIDLGPIDPVLALLRLSPRDLRIKASYAEDQVGGGELRLTRVTEGLRRPLGAGAETHQLALQLAEARDPRTAFELLAQTLDVGPARPAEPPPSLHPTAPLSTALAAPGLRQEDSQTAVAGEEPPLPAPVREALACLVHGVARANALLAETTKGLTPENEAFIRRELPGVLLDEQSVEAATVVRSLRAAAQLDLRAMIAAAAAVSGSLAEARTKLGQLAPDDEFLKSPSAAEAVLFAQKTDFGEVVVAGAGADRHHLPAAILIDLGGDDRYDMAPSPEQPSPTVQVVIDLSGDDVYSPSRAFGPSATMLGISVLVDEAGDDLYVSREPFSFGAATFGVGLLLDAAGSDRYLGGAFSEGAAMFGVGLLLDGAGDDVYEAPLCAQGFGGVKGAGALIDLAGADRYHAGGARQDPVRGRKRTLALAQGFGWGLRPFVSGGVGFLVDAEGADTYHAGNFSQGAGYWYGEGVLLDGAGDDEYLGGECTQGAAAFLSLGRLFDESGDDRYVAYEVAQGAGHDLAVGLLRDASGNDTYVAERMAQGAGSRGGIGLAADLAGDDLYHARADARGYISPDRASAGIGLFTDGGGADAYAGAGGSEVLWVAGEAGAGIDLGTGGLEGIRASLPVTSGLAGVPIKVPVAPTAPWPMPLGLGPEPDLERLWEAATSSPDPGESRRASQTIARLGDKAAPHLVSKLQSPDAETVRQAGSLLVQIGPAAVPELLKAMGDGTTREAQLAMTVLGQIGDPRAATPLAEQAKAPQWRTRAAAAAGMGALRGDDTTLVLEGLLRDEDEDVRRSAVIALGCRGDAESAVAISEVLGDPVFAVRFAAADALVKLGVPCPPHVFSLLASEQPEVRHLSIETFGRLGSKSALDILLGLLDSPDWGDRAFAAEAICRIGDAEATRKLEAMLAGERNGLVLAKAHTAMSAAKLAAPFEQR